MKTLRYRRVHIGEYVIPGEAIDLIEDIRVLELILDLLGTLREESFTVKDRAEARRMKRRVGFILASMHGIAQENLRYGYLAGKPLKHDKHRQTLADVWRMLLEESDKHKSEKKELEKIERKARNGN